ncbi:hypothetical protein XENOCAPTIV_023901, partial [Xenoophorus captivus]
IRNFIHVDRFHFVSQIQEIPSMTLLMPCVCIFQAQVIYCRPQDKAEGLLPDRLGGERPLVLSGPPPRGRRPEAHQSNPTQTTSAPAQTDAPVDPQSRVALCWDKHCQLLPEVLGLTAKRVATWSTEEVRQVYTLYGEAFLLLTQADIVKILSIKLGPALKIYNSILMLKSADEE